MSYLNNLIINRANSNIYSQNELQAYENIVGFVNQWKQSFNATAHYSYNWISIQTQKSGSRAKGTSIKGKSDIDIFVSITDPNNENTTKEYYNDLFNFLNPKFSSRNSIRKQNVSIGIDYAGCSIDITPAKKINQSSYTNNYTRYDDHYLYSRKNDRRMLTNIQKHIDLVRNGGHQKEIMLLKMWRNCHNLDLPSIYIEILASEVLNRKTYDLGKDVWSLLQALRDTVQTRKIVDPSNCNNIISDSVTNSEKQAIQNMAVSSLSKDSWDKIIW